MGRRGEHYPNVWGEGQLLAFSGMEGETSWFTPFTWHTAATPGSLRCLVPGPVELTCEGLGSPAWDAVLGDVLLAPGYQAAFASAQVLQGDAAPGVTLRLAGHELGPAPVVHRLGDRQLAALRLGTRWVVAASPAGETPDLAALLRADLAAIIAARLAFQERVTVPAHLTPDQVRLWRKCLSIMKVNIEAPSGVLRRHWSTPDRWPHRHMWLWDSAFHAVGLVPYAPALAQDILLAMIEQVQPDGMLPHTIKADGWRSEITQPPLLAWAALTVLRRTGDLAWAAACGPYLQRYLDWMLAHRDHNGNGIPEWFIEGEPLCRCGECGLDNSPVYDRAVLLDAPDFGAFLAHDYGCLAELHERLGDATAAAACRSQHQRIGQAVATHLWCPRRRFFFHRDLAGEWVDVEAVSGFVPLFAGICTPEQAAALRDHLADPAGFAAPMPVPSVALRSGTFCKDMWRGPAWLNLSYLTVLGLRRYGFQADADRLRRQLLAGVDRWYRHDGCLWEFYDALDLTPPRQLDRKQRLSQGQGIGPISDYHWTAAVTAAMLTEECP
jgi:hypothetical protein